MDIKKSIPSLKAMPKYIPIILILLGLVFHQGVKYIESLKNYPFWFNLLENFFMAMILIGGIGLLLEVYVFVKYFEDRLTTFFSTETFLRHLNRGSLQIIMNRVMMLLYHGKVTAEGELFPLIRDEVFPDLNKPYIEDYKETIISTIEPGHENFFKRQLEVEYDVINPIKQQYEFIVKIVSVLYPAEGISDKELAQIAELKIDGKDINNPKFDVSKENGLIYFRYKHPILVKDKKVHIFYKESKIITINDNFYITRRDVPTKNFHLVFNFTKGNYELYGELFGRGEKAESIKKSTNLITVDYKGWLLKGHGAAIIFQKSY